MSHPSGIIEHMFVTSLHVKILKALGAVVDCCCVDELAAITGRDPRDVSAACHRLRRLGLIQLESAPIFDLRARQVRAASWSITGDGRTVLDGVAEARARFDARQEHPSTVGTAS